MRPRIAVAVATLGLVAAALLAGCGTAGGGTGELGGTSWTAVSIDGVDTIPEARPTITFAKDGTVGGSSGCNQFSGPYSIDGGSITIGTLTSTQIGCDEPRMSQEATFLGALGGATTWTKPADGELELSGAGRILLRSG